MSDHGQEEWTLQKLAHYMDKRDNYKALLDAINADIYRAYQVGRDYEYETFRTLCELYDG